MLVFHPLRSLIRSIRSFCTARATRAEASPAPRRRLLSRISDRISSAPSSFPSVEPGVLQLLCDYLRPLLRMALFRIFFLGSAFVFSRIGTTWIQQQELLASDGAAGDWFGGSVSLDENTALIGAYGDESFKGSAYIFNGPNQPPDRPTIDGLASGKPGTAYPYNFISVDPDGDEVSYYIEWGDGDTTIWTAFHPSGSPGYNESHSWSTKGKYTIRAKAKDAHGAESNWSTLDVTMPKSFFVINHLIHKSLLERFPNTFPLLKHLFGY